MASGIAKLTTVGGWSEFADTEQFKVPESLEVAQHHLTRNISHFSAHYIFFMIAISLPLTTYFHPYFIIAIAAVGTTAYALFHHLRDKKIVIYGQEVVHHRYRLPITVVVTIFALWATSSVQVLFYCALAGAFCGLVHSIFRRPVTALSAPPEKHHESSPH